MELHRISNEQRKRITSLSQKKNRVELKKFIVEGHKMASEVLEYRPENCYLIYCTEQYLEKFPLQHDKLHVVSAKDLERISQLKNPQGILMVVDFLDKEKNAQDFYIALDAVQDPGNFGTILRMADWYGVKTILCSKDCVDVYNSKVVQASMGAIFRVGVNYVDLNLEIEKLNLPVFGALLEGENIYSQELLPKGILLMGNEGNGISEELQKKVSHKLTIPRIGASESLNVSMATGIMLSEFFRSSLK